MAKTFMVRFPPCFPKSERERITKMLDGNSFMQLPTRDDGEVEFLFEGDRHTPETLRSEFQIPAGVEVLDTSHWQH